MAKSRKDSRGYVLRTGESQRKDGRYSYSYTDMYNHFVRPTFGKRLIGKIKYSDVKKFYYRIILDEEMKANTLDSIHTQLHPAFQMAVRDGLLR